MRVRIVPFADAAIMAMLAPFTLLDFGDEENALLYREGILPNGEPVQALVAGDIPVDGRMFSCVNCHQRSGLGSVEGSLITWPTTGKELYIPRRRTGAWNAAAAHKGPGAVERWTLPPQYRAADARPAYTDETLKRAIREGIGADGEPVPLPLAGRDPGKLAERLRLNDACLALQGTYGADLPSYAERLAAMGGDLAAFVAALREHGLTVATGMFGAHMEVELVNDGPVTLLLDSKKLF